MAECLAYIEMQLSSKVLEEFSGTFCTLYSRKLCFEKEINVNLQVNTLYFLDVLSILRSASVPDLRFVLDFAICS